MHGRTQAKAVIDLTGDHVEEKVSFGLKSRLEHESPESEVEALILLAPPELAPGDGTSYADLKRRSTSEHIGEITKVLAEQGGHLLGEPSLVLGAVPVIASLATINTLVALPWVRSVTENRSIDHRLIS